MSKHETSATVNTLVDPLFSAAAKRGEQASYVHTDESGYVVTAAHSNNTHDTCPLCGKSMTPIDAAGIASFVCLDHRVVMPAADSHAGTDYAATED